VILSNWIQLTKSTERHYDPADETRFQQSTTTYFYDTRNVGHLQVSRTETTRSDGSTLVNSTTYPADYSTVTTGPLAAMHTDAVYQHAVPVESLTQVYAAGQTLADARTVAGSYTEYTQPTTSSQFLPATISTLELAQPATQLAAAAPSLPARGRYVRRQKVLYDPATANVRQQQPEHGSPMVYLWGYGSTLPVAQIKNASLAQVQAALSVDVNTLTTDQQLRDACQQLRQRLPQAQVTSFTYQPLVGLTSQTDPSGRTTTYEYDGLGRLLRTRDERGRILSQQQYHYAGK